MKDYIQVDVTGDADGVTSETYVENTIENPIWYTVEDNRVSLVSENVEKVSKLPDIMFDNCLWESRIGITKDDANQSNRELPLEFQDVTDNNIYLNHVNASDEIFHCYICGKSYDFHYLLKKHLAKHKRQVKYKTYKCKYCGKRFKSKFGFNEHIQKYHNSVYECRTSRRSIDCYKYSEHKKSHEIRDKIQKSSVLRQQSVVSTASQSSMANNCHILNVKQEKDLSTNVRETASQSSMANNCHILNIKQEKDLSTNVRETASQSSMANNCHILNIKQEKDLSTNVREKQSSGQVVSVNSNESTWAYKPPDLMAEKNSINIANNNIVSKVRETPYFCIRKLPNIKIGFCNDDFDQTSQDNVIFICRICKDAPSSDLDSFALHMSEHIECNMHECIVCDTKFDSVALWAYHMDYHQKQIDLNVSTVQFNLLETGSNTLDPINPRNVEPQGTDHEKSPINSDNLLLKNKLSGPVNNQNNNLTNHINKRNEEKSTFCKFCNKNFTHQGAFTNHMRIHGHKTYKCKFCCMQFSTKGNYIKHKKTHDKYV